MRTKRGAGSHRLRLLVRHVVRSHLGHQLLDERTAYQREIVLGGFVEVRANRANLGRISNRVEQLLNLQRLVRSNGPAN